MPRYFLEVGYKGAGYSGFQTQENANSIQDEVEKAIAIFFRVPVAMTGSSRTDTGVNAVSNFFHFDFAEEISGQVLYNINALMPSDIVAKGIYSVEATAHCRFDAISRRYAYWVYRYKDPFLDDRAYYFPYSLDFEKLEQCAAIVSRHEDFTSFAKRNSQATSFNCRIMASGWREESGSLVYTVESNRFLRGMVRGLAGTMLQVGRGKLTTQQFEEVIEARDSSRADFSVPGHGLFLEKVGYPKGMLRRL